MFPEPLLARDAAGNLYGTTLVSLGNIFKIDTAGKVSVLYTFTGEADGCYPVGLILDKRGNLYGVTTGGGSAPCGSGDGVVFELDAARNFSVLHTFGGGDGASPDSILLFDAAGNLYGTTNSGGGSDTCQGGCGTVFKLAPNGNGTWTESVLYSFCSLDGCADGWYPGRGPLAIDAAGSLYGVAGLGGAHSCFGGGGCGLVYKLEASGHEVVLYNFAGGKDGLTLTFPRLTIGPHGTRTEEYTSGRRHHDSNTGNRSVSRSVNGAIRKKNQQEPERNENQNMGRS